MAHPLPLVSSVLWDALMLDASSASPPGCTAAAPPSQPEAPYAGAAPPLLGIPPALDSLAGSPERGGSWALHHYFWDAEAVRSARRCAPQLRELAHRRANATHATAGQTQLLARAAPGDRWGDVDIAPGSLGPQPLPPAGVAPRQPPSNRSSGPRRRRVPEATRPRCCVAGCTTAVGTRHFNRRSHACDGHVAAHSVDLDGSGACCGLRLVQPTPDLSDSSDACSRCLRRRTKPLLPEVLQVASAV